MKTSYLKAINLTIPKDVSKVILSCRIDKLFMRGKKLGLCEYKIRHTIFLKEEGATEWVIIDQLNTSGKLTIGSMPIRKCLFINPCGGTIKIVRDTPEDDAFHKAEFHIDSIKYVIEKTVIELL